uniref:Uncharacterized protein n=1 Tax=Arundo donax TaxID=35708 RepID=A0A0A9AUD9_ARUDO
MAVAATATADPPGYFVGRPLHYEAPQAPPPRPSRRRTVCTRKFLVTTLAVRKWDDDLLTLNPTLLLLMLMAQLSRTRGRASLPNGSAASPAA